MNDADFMSMLDRLARPYEQEQLLDQFTAFGFDQLKVNQYRQIMKDFFPIKKIKPSWQTEGF